MAIMSSKLMRCRIHAITVEEHLKLNSFVPLLAVANDLIYLRTFRVRPKNELLSVQVVRVLKLLELCSGNGSRVD